VELDKDGTFDIQGSPQEYIVNKFSLEFLFCFPYRRSKYEL